MLTIRSMFDGVRALLLIAVYLLVAGSRPLAAQATNKCPLNPQGHSLYPMLTADMQKRVVEGTTNLCQRWIEAAPPDSAGWRARESARFLDNLIMQHAYCRGAIPNKAVLARWDGNPAFKAVQIVVEKYCADTSHPNSDIGGRTWWLRTEIFCQSTRYFVDPAGWKGIFKPNTPSWKKLEDASLALCEQVRTKHLSLDEAYYRFDQAWLYAKSNLTRELGQRTASNIVGTLKGAVTFAPKVVGLLPK